MQSVIITIPGLKMVLSRIMLSLVSCILYLVSGMLFARNMYLYITSLTCHLLFACLFLSLYNLTLHDDVQRSLLWKTEVKLLITADAEKFS